MVSARVDDMNLQPQFSKLGHSLEEIRVRALQSILSKLEHGLLGDVDLVQEKHLHIRLLEWFNFPSCPNQNDVLTLILRLSKHPSAASIYLDIGTVEFLTQLRQNSPGALHGLIDNILDNLFHLPAPQPPRGGAREQTAVYKHQHHTQQQHGEQQGVTVTSGSVLPSHLLEASMTSSHGHMPPSGTPGAQQQQHSFPSPADPVTGYFHNHQSHDTLTGQVSPSCFRFSMFPWIALTLTDKHVLSSTDTSLRSKEVALVLSACEFLSDVVFEDFPAEVSLQRPAIVKSLLSLLSIEPSMERSVTLYAVWTLTDLTRNIQARIAYYQDPALYTPRQDFSAGSGMSSSSTSSFLSHSLGSSDTRPSLIGRSDNRRQSGDGQDNTDSSSSASQLGGLDEQTDVDDITSLQYLQWSVGQYCCEVLSRALPCLKAPDERLSIHVLQLLHDVTALLRCCVDPDDLWQDTSPSATEMTEKLQSSLEMCGDVLYLHYHGNLSARTPAPELQQHRVTFVGLAGIIVDLLQAVLPPDRASEGLPSEFIPILALLAHDESLSYQHGSIREASLLYLSHLDTSPAASEAFTQYLEAQQICTSLHSTCSFMAQFDELNDESQQSLVSLAEEALISVPYHASPRFVHSCIHLAAFIGKKANPNPHAAAQSHEIILRLLASGIVAVRQQAYTSLLDIVKDSLCVSQMCEPTSSITQGCVFLLHEDLLYHITSFGLTDSDNKVSQCANDILLYLLQSQLLMPATRWQQLLTALTTVLPSLQGYASLESPLGRCILGLLDTESSTGALPIHERFRGTLRMLFRPETRLRAESLKQLAWHLAHESDSMRKLPLFSELNVSHLSDLFVCDLHISLLDQDTSRSIFKPEGLHKVYGILTSEKVEAGVRKSAADQIAIILQDPALHGSFMELGGLDHVLDSLHIGLRKPETGSADLSLLPAWITILRCLLQHDATLRHRLATQKSVYFAVLRASLLLQEDSSSKHEAAQLMAFLLFDEVAAIDPSTETLDSSGHQLFSLPAFIVKRYQLPFTPASYHAHSPHRSAVPPVEDADPLSAGALGEMLRLSWHTAWHDGIQQTIERHAEDGEQHDEYNYSASLCLSAVDRTILESTYLPHALTHCIHACENATSHAAVTTAVLRLTSYLVTSPGPAMKLLVQTHWKDALVRFLLVCPSSRSDEALLCAMLQLLELIIAHGAEDSTLHSWLADIIHNPKAALLSLLSTADQDTTAAPPATRQLHRQLLKFVRIYTASYPWCLTDRGGAGCVHGELSGRLLGRISSSSNNKADSGSAGGGAGHFYNLAALESTLLALSHVTARPGWSSNTQDSLQLCLNMLNTLLEVVSAFHIGRGGASMSYMGRGVTRCATLSLRHLATEMAAQLHSQDWPRNWLYSRQATVDTVGESGLHWLIPLWTYRDPQVRAAGVGIAVALTSTEAGRITMTTQCQHIPGGIWGKAFSVLLDQTECSLVRQQAALLLTNLTSQPMPGGNVDTAPTVWQGPVVHSNQQQETQVGLSALLTLLQHSEFYDEMLALLQHYYPQATIDPIMAAATGYPTPSSTLTSQLTATTPGSVTPRGSHSRLTDTATSTNVEDTTQQRAQSSAIGGPRNTSTPSSSSSTSSMSRDGPGVEMVSVVTPGLVTCVCGLLHNLLALAPQQTATDIATSGIHDVLISLLSASELSPSEAEGSRLERLSTQDLLSLHTSVLRVLTLCSQHNPVVAHSVLVNADAAKEIMRLLGVASYIESDTDCRVACEQLWRSVMELLTSLLQLHGATALQHLTVMMVKHWPTIIGRCLSLLQQGAGCGEWLHHFLACLFTEEAKLQSQDKYNVTERLDAPVQDDSDALFPGSSSGSLLCQSLVRAYEATLQPRVTDPARMLPVTNSLKALLAISTTAKEAALEAGLVEVLCDQLRRLHSELSLDALELNKPSPRSNSGKKDNPIIIQTCLTLSVLRNLMLGYTEAKVAAHTSGLSVVIHKMWAWCQVEPSLMLATLHTLTVYTARCPQACGSLSLSGLTEDKQHSNSASLLHAILKLMIKLMTSPSAASTHNTGVLKTAFSLVSTLALTQECRGVLWKSNFLLEFSKLNVSRSKKSKSQRVVESLWLDLLVNLSFSTEGQNMILKINESISLLLELSVTEVMERKVILILRNLCFHTANKPKVLANEKVVSCFLHHIEESSVDTGVIACSALHALLHNSQKAKVSLKSQQVVRRIQDAYNHYANLPDVPAAAQCAQTLHNVLIILKL